MGTALLWGMAHDQVTKAIPWEPPTQLAFYSGSLKDEFEVEKAAQSLENFFRSFAEEMKIAIRALGKTSLRDVNADDLVALDKWTSAVTKVRLVTQPDELVR
jgi:glutamate synthase domain-containing protein 2